jgi:N-methylhydantoinase B
MIDAVTLSVIRFRLEQIVDEMDATLFRAAFSPVIAEARDGSHGIYNAANGDTIAMGKTGLPVFIGAMSHAARAAIKRADTDGGFKDGDVILLNDPYDGATHLNDIKLVKPLFRGGKPFCLLASVGHWIDVGGNVAGNYNPVATDIMQEGFRVPAVKLFDRGTLRQDVIDVLLANTRLPQSCYGDLNAQLGALDLGESRMIELLDEYGDDMVAEAIGEILARSARQMRSLIAELADGTYSYSDFIDNDGLSDAPLEVALDLTVRGEEMTIDLSRSAPGCAGPMNVARGTTIAACFVALKHVFPEVPANAGCLEPIHFEIPDGTILSAEAPKPVSGYTENIMRTIDVVFGAIAQVAPGRANGASFSTVNVVLLSGKRDDGSDFIFFTFFGGGLGGNPEGDGLSHGNAPIGMATIPPVEILEAAYPVRFTNWGLRCDSGGAGRHRGGLGAVYEIELRADQAMLVAFGERAIYPAFGVLGGGAGAPNRVVFDQDDGPTTPRLGTKQPAIRLTRGQRVRIESPGGGGYGAPGERALDDIARDLRLGLVSADRAQSDYAIAVAPDGTIERRAA